jgi:hypothetical protein
MRTPDKILGKSGEQIMSDVINASDLQLSGVQERAQQLLGQGIQASIVAQTLGVTESYISQLLSQQPFLEGVTKMRYEALQKHNARDAEYDSLEDELLIKLKATLPLMFDPMKILRAIQVINAAKRRGSTEQGSVSQHNMVVNLTMPTAIIERFSVMKDANNQIIEAGSQKLVTIQSGTLLERVSKNRTLENGNGNENSQQIGAPATATEIPTSPRRIGAPGADPFAASSKE